RGSGFYEDWARNYTDGVPAVALGGIVRQPDLGRTLEALASQGPGYLYGGALGERIVAHLSKLGGCLTLADLGPAKPQWKEPRQATYRGLWVNPPPPPSEAFQFLLTLRVLDGVDLARLERNGVEHLDTVWRAIRLAAGERIANNFPTPTTLAHL